MSGMEGAGILKELPTQSLARQLSSVHICIELMYTCSALVSMPGNIFFHKDMSASVAAKGFEQIAL